jgi:MoaA/NifB/PqqE/SkfB family radical SAM enzyme
MPITTLGLVLGYTCNIRCRHCLWGDTLDDKRRMSVEDARHYIDMASQIDSIRLVGFAGGETFIFKDVMRKAMLYAAGKYGLPSTISTNSSWATSLRKAQKILGGYHRIGLRRLQLSIDDFHQEWVPLERVRNALTIAQDLGITSTIVCIVSAKSRRLSDYLDDLGVAPGPLIEVAEAPVTPVGFASTRMASSEIQRADGVPSDFCSMLNVLNILPDGSVQMCCGAPFSMSELKAGNAKQNTLTEIVEEAEWNPIFNALSIAEGPRLLVEALEDAGKDGFLKRGCYGSSCDACQHILREKPAMEFLKQALDEQRAQLFLDRFQAVLPAQILYEQSKQARPI